ncbi:hypothetical protein FG386_003128 [Cryptosporidium ryanae]|uniref:uncharacterized protein n=1 Tax=Cryptosporidium ryanae TaxID=515981 RepID=UPI003519E961|nr:hypothetical protein FG386_003128 [Cryptosporidium ryanae]
MFWLIDWGVSCSQGGCKENQDGWFITIPRNIKAGKFAGGIKYPFVGHEGGSDRNKASGYSKGVWNLDPITQQISKAGSYDGLFNSCSGSVPDSPSSDKAEGGVPGKSEDAREGAGAGFCEDPASRSPEGIPNPVPRPEFGSKRTSRALGDTRNRDSVGEDSAVCVNGNRNGGIELDMERIKLSQRTEDDMTDCVSKRSQTDESSSGSGQRRAAKEPSRRDGRLDGGSDNNFPPFGNEIKRIDEMFPVVFPLFPLPPLQPKKTGPNWVSHTCGGKSCSNFGIKEVSRSCQFFGLLDGHGHYGKMASHLAAYCLSETIVKDLSDARDDVSLGDYLEKVLDVLNKGFSYAHESVIKANISSKKDFGTTCIVVGIVDKYLITANCGDSSAICIVPNQKKRIKPDLISENTNTPRVKRSNLSEIRLPDLPVPLAPRKKASSSVYDLNNVFGGPGGGPTTGTFENETEGRSSSQSYHKIYYLSNPHCLVRKSERQRIDQSGVGKVVLGDYGMLRLIPSYLTYQQARDMGLSISMSRSLGHMYLSRCALLPTPDYRIFNIGIGSPRRESLRSIRSAEEEEAVKRMENEKMISFSEALVEQSVISLGWRNPRPSHVSSTEPHTESIELDWSTDDDSFINNGFARCRCCSENPLSNCKCVSASNRAGDDSNENAARSSHTTREGQEDADNCDAREWEECYVVIMSDGISDILDGFSIADIIINSVDKTLEEIAATITSEAEKKRRFNNIRADNCTAIVVRIGTRPRPEAAESSANKLTGEGKMDGGAVQLKKCDLPLPSIFSSCKDGNGNRSANSNGNSETTFSTSSSRTSGAPRDKAVVGPNLLCSPNTASESGNPGFDRSERLAFCARRNPRGSRPDAENGVARTSFGTGSLVAARSENCTQNLVSNSSLRRAFTPISRRRRIATPSPSRARTCKLREVPSLRNNI